MERYIMDQEDRAFVEALRAGLGEDESTEYGWVRDLPADPGVPTREDQVIIEGRAIRPHPARRRQG